MRKVTALVLMIVLLAMCACTSTINVSVTDTLENMRARIKEDSVSIQTTLFLDPRINNGVENSYVTMTRKGKDNFSFGFSTTQNGMTVNHKNAVIGQKDNVFVDADTLFSYLEGNEIDLLVSSAGQTAGKYLCFDKSALSQTLITSADKTVKDWTVAHHNIESGFSDVAEYAKVLKSCQDSASAVRQSFDTLYAAILTPETLTAVTEYCKQYNDVLSDFTDSILLPLKTLFEAPVQDGVDYTIAESASGSGSSFDYMFSVRSRDGKTTLGSFSVAIRPFDGEPDTPTVKKSQNVGMDEFGKTLCSDISDLLSNNFETVTQWDEYKITDSSLSLIMYADGADMAVEYTFLNGRPTKFKITFRTKDTQIHNILRKAYGSRGYIQSADEEPGENNGVLEYFTMDTDANILASNARFESPGAMLDYFIYIGQVAKSEVEVR